MDDSRISRRDGAAEPAPIARFRQEASPRGPVEAGTEGAPSNPGAAGVRSQASTADLFALLWKGLADILGTAAAATLLRRAIQRATPRAPELSALSITRESLEYRYTLPSNWTSPVSDPSGALSELAAELWPLLVDLTGSVVTQRLAQIPELRALAIRAGGEPPP